ncbi:MAG: HDOD domain-containing protein, partial [Planctomycetaceae bacterium]
SSLYGFRHPARNVSDAVARLGVRGAVRFLVTSAVNEVMKSSKSKLINFNAFWCSNLERALFAREVAKLLGADEGTAYSAAMLCDCLLPVVTNRAADDYVEFVTDQVQKKQPIVDFENDRFGWDHSMATSLLLRGWKFPADVIYCVRMHHSGLEILKDSVVGTSAAAAVAIAALIPDPLLQEPTGLADLTRLESAWSSFSLSDLAETVHEQFQELSPDVSNPFPLRRRLPKLAETADEN